MGWKDGVREAPEEEQLFQHFISSAEREKKGKATSVPCWKINKWLRVFEAVALFPRSGAVDWRVCLFRF